jgi:hypothetical protein
MNERDSRTHGYICECNLRSCRRRLYLRPDVYDKLAQIGTVLSPECASREGRVVLRSENGAKAVYATRIVL